MDENLARLRLARGSRRVLEALMRLPSVRRSGSGWPRQERLAADAGLSLRGLRLALRRLEDAGLLRTARSQYGLDYRLPWHPQFGPFRPSAEWRKSADLAREKVPISNVKSADLSESSPYPVLSFQRAKSSTRARGADAASPAPPSDRQPEPLPAEIEAETLRLALAHVDAFPSPGTARRILAAAGPVPPAEALARFKAWAEDRSFRVARRFRHFGGLVMAFAEDLPAVKARLGLEGPAHGAMPRRADGTLDSPAIEASMERFDPEGLGQMFGDSRPAEEVPAPGFPLEAPGPFEAPGRRDPGPAFDFDRAFADVAAAKVMPDAGGFQPRPGPTAESHDSRRDVDSGLSDVLRRRLARAAQHPTRNWF
ncbi:MAG TPA: hypothetical protein DCY80_18820 [Solibacterales bacterium]|nr:hypothetical protein [Bryobacterales bacterium]